MGNVLKYACTFLGGALIGAAGTYLYFDKKFKDLANTIDEQVIEETESIKKAYKELVDEISITDEDLIAAADSFASKYVSNSSEPEQYSPNSMKKSPAEKIDYTAYSVPAGKASEMNDAETESYMNDVVSRIDKEIAIMKGEPEPVGIAPDPYQISHADFGSQYGYDMVDLVYYEDSILADSNDDVIYDHRTIDEAVGLENFEEFLNDDDYDAMYIRNERHKIDYELVKSALSYNDIAEAKPRRNDL